MIKITHYGLFLVFTLLYLTQSAVSIYQSEVGLYDWHHTWVGHPNEAFVIDDKHLLLSTQLNTIASVSSETGTLEWRQSLDNELVSVLISDQGILTVTNNPERAQLWNKITGQLVWEYNLGGKDFYESNTPVFWDNGYILVLNDNRLLMLSKEGKEVWTKTIAPDQSLHKMKLYKREGVVYAVIGPEDEPETCVFTIHTIDRATGDSSKTLSIPCDFDNNDVAYIGDHLLWTEDEELKWASIHTEEVKSVSLQSLIESLPNAEEYAPNTISIVGDNSANSNSFVILVEYEADNKIEYTSALFRISDDGSTIHLIKDFDIHLSPGGIDFSGTTAIRALGTQDELTVHLSDTQEVKKIPLNFAVTGNINYIKLINRNPFQIFVVTDGSSVFYINETDIVWSREEALSSVAATEFLDLPEQKLWTQMSDELNETKKQKESENLITRYIHRLSTHVIELRGLPAWLVSYFVGLTGSSMDKDHNGDISIAEAQSCWLNQTRPEILYRDNFGLRKLLISVSKSGKVIAQDTTRKGKIVWTRYLETFSFTNIYVVRPPSVKLPPVIVAVGSTYDEVGGAATGFLRLNALTGEDYVATSPLAEQFFEANVVTNVGVDKIMKLPIEDPEERTQILAIYEAGSGRVFIYPDTYETQKKFVSEFLPDFYFTYTSPMGHIQGFKVVEGYRGSLKVMPLWRLNIPSGETIVATTQPRSDEKVALLGRALGNRNVLYKYLNPHLFAVVTKNIDKKSIKVRLMDSVKGSILYENIHENVDVDTNEVHITQSENWFVYHFWSNDNKVKGYQAVVLELYEGEYENERVDSSNFSSFENIQPHVISSAFSFPFPVSAMGVTSTRNGISTKDVLFGLPTHQIMGISKRLLDPRRPRDTPSKDDKEELLYPYGPIPDDRRFSLTYNLDVVGIKSIITSPSLLESTSLVFAYGVDTFFTRVSPSKQFDVLSPDFSKIQLLLTLTGLVVAIRITGPMVRRKRVNALWK
ncbi:hypothetical protein BDB01DRAFT_175618 [Pilobolus umbonatus]|nr:hypothetical protein BDB01DRAFT_175618 [Pilobolus umbonatus]